MENKYNKQKYLELLSKEYRNINEVTEEISNIYYKGFSEEEIRDILNS